MAIGAGETGNGNVEGGGVGGDGGGGDGGGAAGAGNAGGDPPYEYKLPGQQVEPSASLWLDPPGPIRVPTNQMVQDIAERTPTGSDDRIALDFARDFPGRTGSPTPSENRLKAQLDLLVALQGMRDGEPYPAGKPIGADFPELGNKPFHPTPLSRFLQLQPVPFGTVFDVVERRQRRVVNVVEQHARILDGTRIVNEGQELARVFEIETPGLYHRHALNWAFFNRPDISPPRQARVWMALDIAIYTALSAGWWYKWLRRDYSRLLRPEEYDKLRNGDPGKLRVLFDNFVGEQGQEDGMPRRCPRPTPGTPRHPAWPSGHSTYSAAASHLMEFFLSPDTIEVDDETLFGDFPPDSVRITEPGWIAAELRRLANNIGEARLWGGVHWLSDHLAGQRIGRAAAEAVIAQFRGDCVPPVDRRTCEEAMKDGDTPPTDAEIRAMIPPAPPPPAPPCPPGQDTIPPREGAGGGAGAAAEPAASRGTF